MIAYIGMKFDIKFILRSHIKYKQNTIIVKKKKKYLVFEKTLNQIIVFLVRTNG